MKKAGLSDLFMSDYYSATTERFTASSVDTYVKLLLHMDGINGSTTFTDSSNTPKSVAVYGNARIDTAQSVFGGASGYFDGSGDFLYLDDSDDWNVGAGDFTVDCRVRRGSSSGSSYIVGQTDSTASFSGTSFALIFNSTGKVQFYVASGGTGYVATSPLSYTSTSDWHHFAGVRDGNTLRLFVNGTQVATADVTGVTVNNSSRKLAVGRIGEYDGAYFTGYIDELRISKGIARWTANFTPPTEAY